MHTLLRGQVYFWMPDLNRLLVLWTEVGWLPVYGRGVAKGQAALDPAAKSAVTH